VCKLHERWRYWAKRDEPYKPGPDARVKIERLRSLGLWQEPVP
jgi:hypothetical protein